MRPSSRRTLPVFDPPAAGPELSLDRGGDPLGSPEAPENAPNMARRYALLTGNLAEIRPAPDLLPENCEVRDRLEGQIETSTDELYSLVKDKASKNIQEVKDGGDQPSIALAVRELMEVNQYKQRELSEALGAPQSTVSKWLHGDLKPSPAMYVRLSKLASVEKRAYWLGLAGIPFEEPSEEVGVRWVPLLRDPAACGTPRAMDDHEVEEMLSVPRGWLPNGGTIFAVKVTGDSMSPLLEEGYIALVDISRRVADKLVDHMVLARDGDEITLKWLRHQESMLLLVPQNTSLRHPIQVWTRSDNRAIVGEVVGWFGTPYRPRKRK